MKRESEGRRKKTKEATKMMNDERTKEKKSKVRACHVFEEVGDCSIWVSRKGQRQRRAERRRPHVNAPAVPSSGRRSRRLRMRKRLKNSFI